MNHSDNILYVLTCSAQAKAISLCPPSLTHIISTSLYLIRIHHKLLTASCKPVNSPSACATRTGTMLSSYYSQATQLYCLRLDRRQWKYNVVKMLPLFYCPKGRNKTLEKHFTLNSTFWKLLCKGILLHFNKVAVRPFLDFLPYLPLLFHASRVEEGETFQQRSLEMRTRIDGAVVWLAQCLPLREESQKCSSHLHTEGQDS